MTDCSDEDLMLAYKLDDHQAFQILYKRYKPRVFSYILTKTQGGRESAEDIFQRVWIKLHKSRLRYNGEILFSRWIFTICRSEIIDFYRKESKYKHDELEEQKTLGSQKDDVGDHFDEVMSTNTLTVEDRTALTLRYVKEMSFQDIAEQIGLSPVSVRKRISRAIAKIRKKMESVDE